jgi:hypothetical protein
MKDNLLSKNKILLTINLNNFLQQINQIKL